MTTTSPIRSVSTTASSCVPAMVTMTPPISAAAVSHSASCVRLGRPRGVTSAHESPSTLAGDMQTDADLLVLARAGDRHALGAIYDRYADRLYDLCSSVLRDPDTAFDAMVDTFVLAALELYRVRKPDRLESWLFAIAREQLLVRKIPIGIDEHAEFDGESAAAATVGAGAIVWEAVSWLPPRDRILLDLNVRQSLDNKGLAAAIGVSMPHAAALVRDLDERVERLMSALLVA